MDPGRKTISSENQDMCNMCKLHFELQCNMYKTVQYIQYDQRHVLYNDNFFCDFYFPIFSRMLSNGNKQHRKNNTIREHGEMLVLTH